MRLDCKSLDIDFARGQKRTLIHLQDQYGTLYYNLLIYILIIIIMITKKFINYARPTKRAPNWFRVSVNFRDVFFAASTGN